MKNKKLTTLKKRIMAAALCAAMLAGTLATDGLLSYRERNDVSADELDVDEEFLNVDKTEEVETDDVSVDKNMNDISDAELSDILDDEQSDDNTVSDEEDMSDTEQIEGTDSDEADDEADDEAQTDSDEVGDEADGEAQTDSDEVGDEADDEAQTEPKEVVLTGETEGFYVTVEGMSDSLNGAVEVRIKDVTEEKASGYETYFSKVALDKGILDTVYLVPHVFDVSLFNEDGEEVEPTEGVNVSFYGDIIKETLAKDGYELSIYHDELSGVLPEGYLDDLSSSMFLENEDSTDESVLPDFYLSQVEFEEADGVLKFETGGFSDYALVLTGNNTQKEFTFDDGTYFELDKYLKENGEANGQTAYNVFLEHAFYDSSQAVVNNFAPARTDFMFCLDQSASVSGYTDDYNEAVKALLHKIADTNREREQNALDGKYDDIDPDFVAQSDANMVSAMRDHYMYVAGIVGYNNHLYERLNAATDPVLIRTEAEADVMAAKAYVKPDYSDYCNGATDTDQQDFTRTDLGTKWMYDNAKRGSWNYTYKTNGATFNWNSLCCVLITDGDPYGEETTPTWPYPDSNFPGNAFSIYSANRALYYANKLKQECGAMNFGIYVPFRNGDNASVLKAVDSGDIFDLVITPGKDIITLAFLSLWSSDIPNNGLFHTVGNDNFHGDTDGAFDVFYSGKDTFGKYIYADRSYPDLVNYVDSIVARINTEAWKSVNSRGYFSADTVMQDEITDPFEVIGQDSIQVYAVPRIPVNLDSDGIPTDMDANTYEVSEFRWGEMTVEDSDGEMTSEWIDVTKDVVITLNGGRVTVTGYDYEWNAVTDYDKDMIRYEENDSRGNGLIYKPGDYGYKLVIIIPIQAKFSFGGNSIKTNNSDVSGVMPSDPVGNNPNPPWQENEKLNPDGNKFLDMYPVPEVDLNVSYKITKDNAIIYAPQTKELHDLLTDTMNSIWYVDDGYFNLKTIRDNAKWDFETKEETYYNLLTDAQDPIEIVQAQQEMIEARNVLDDAQKNLDAVLCYIPDGRNNAFVDIFYSFQDPDGNRIATMSIPHGMAYDADSPNIDWNMVTDGMVLNEDGNPIITKSGTYTILATVTPVDTEKSPDWHVYTDLDDADQQTIHPYHSEDYSSTGSTADGSQSELTIQENPEAYLFTLELTADDSRREPDQAIDFFEGSGEMRDTIDRAVNKHLNSYKWVCTDGMTESKTENEPGVDKKMVTGSDVMLEVNVPDAAFTDGLVEDVSSVTTVRAETGQYIPVGIVTWRSTGCLNKSATSDEQVRQRDVVMTETDNIYGPGISSVRWTHECDIITEHDCTEHEFVESHQYDEVEQKGSAGVVRFLMHVYENPQPDIEKSTTTPVITLGSEILWDIRLENTDYDKNNHMLPSDFSMVDILPWLGDKRVDPNYGADRKDGSDFGGDLYYTKMSIDHSNLAAGSEGIKVYYTNDTAVRTATEQQLLGKTSGLTWVEASSYEVSDTVTGFTIPNTARAVRLDTTLAWEETLDIDLGANVKNLADQEVGDYYCNTALILQDKGQIISSEVVTTEVVSLHIAGTVWEDSDLDGLMMSDEPKISGIRVTLYQPYNSKNPNRVIRTIEGLQLSEVFDLDNNKFVPVNTGTNGSFMFDNIPSGTYYVVADLIPEDFDVTKKKAGEGNGNDAMIDSEAEPKFIASGEALEKTLWIKAITITNSSADNQNIGLTRIKGNIDVGKVVNEIFYPSAMTEEEREDYRINATFVLRNQATGIEYRRTVYLKEDTIQLKNERPQVWAHFEDLPLGTYELTEVFDPNYHLSGVKYTKGDVTFDSSLGITTVEITADNTEVQLWMENVARPDPPGGDENGVTNFVNIRTPIKLEVIYSGPDPISDHSIYEYTFKASDFDNRNNAADGSGKKGDIIVTYDDGSQIKLSDGTLSFDALTFNPASVDSSMNSDRRRTNISVFYVERGHMVRDSFNVRVDLKPYFRFNVLFNANGSSFDDSAATNNVDFMYNDLLGYNEITTGVYKDTNNNGLNVLNGFWQAGWNTSPDGQGIQYGGEADALTPLNTIGKEKNLTSLQLYANWKTNVVFHANGGTINGQGSQTVAYSKGQSIGSPGTPSKTNHKFVLWNTKPDGTGEELSEYNRNHSGCQGPITFYAIYYQSDYAFTGTVQTFTAPVSGWYQIECWGAQGGGNGWWGTGGRGGYAKGTFYIEVGTSLNVYVGGAGINSGIYNQGGWNGGGTVNGTATIDSASGGGATDIRVGTSLYNRFIVAGGGGGCSDNGSTSSDKSGGHGGGLSGGYSPNGIAGGSQTSGASFGYGQSLSGPCRGGAGGGGWYGGYATTKYAGGGGGSGYVSGYSGCSDSLTGYIGKNCYMSVGMRQGNGFARIILSEQ